MDQPIASAPRPSDRPFLPLRRGKIDDRRLLMEADNESPCRFPRRPGPCGRAKWTMSIITLSTMPSSSGWSKPTSSPNGPMSSTIATAARRSRSRKRCKGARHLFDIDWQGTQQLECASAPTLCGSSSCRRRWRELERRLHARGTDTEEVIEFRMRRAAGEIGHWAEYDYVLINDDMDKCPTQVHAIIAAERCARDRQPYLLDFVRELVDAPIKSASSRKRAAARKSLRRLSSTASPQHRRPIARSASAHRG